MKQKILIWILVAICLISSSYAVLNDAVLYYTFDDDDFSGTTTYDISGNGYNGTNVGLTTGATGIINQSYSFDGSGDYVNNIPRAGTYTPYTTGNWTITFWLKRDDFTKIDHIWSFEDSNTLYMAGNDCTAWTIFGATGTGSMDMCAYDVAGSWGFYAFVYDDNDNIVMVYANNTNLYNKTYIPRTGTGGVNKIGTRYTSPGANDYLKGDLDEFGVWNRALSLSEVQELYNSGNGYNPYYVTPELSISLISPSNNAINNSLNIDFNYNYTHIENAETCNLLTNETGSFTIEETDNTVNANTTLTISHSFINEGAYLWGIGCNLTNGTFYYSSNRTINLATTNITIRATEIVSGDYINTFNVSFDDGNLYQTTDGYISLFTTTGTHKFNITGAGYYDEITEQTINAVNGSTYTVNGLYSGKLNISAKYVNNATLISNFKAQVTSLNNSWSQNFTSIGQLVNATLIDGTYTVSILGYAQGTSQENITISSALQSLQIIVYQINSFNFTFLNEETEALITDAKIYIEFVL